MNILAVGCHPDDVEIACAGTLAKCVKRGDRVTVCHVSNGNLGHVEIPPDTLAVMRKNEAKRAGALAGIAPTADNLPQIAAGIAKVNIFTDLCKAGDDAVRKALDEGLSYLAVRDRKVAAVREAVKRKIRLFGSENKA